MSAQKGNSGTQKKPDRQDELRRQNEAVARRMEHIKNTYVVLSGKGGVGKSSVAANLALALSERGRSVGLLDIDIHGPSIPKMFGLDNTRLASEENAIIPARFSSLKIMSIGFTLRDQDEAVIWRGPMKYTAIRQFLGDVEWGDLDYLIIDSPPGTGDEPLSVVQLAGNPTGGIVVTTPQGISINDVRKSVTFCRRLDLPVAGVIENMSGYVCPACGEVSYIFKQGGGEGMADEMGVPFLGRIPIETRMVEACDAGTPFVEEYADTETASLFADIAETLDT